MKKFFSIVSIVAALSMLVSCGETKNYAGPSFTWVGDEISGGRVEILGGMNAAMTIDSEAGVNSLLINVTLPNSSFAGAINAYITNSENKVAMDGKSRTCVLDLCNDPKAYGVLCGSSARGKNSVTISFNKLIESLTSQDEMAASELSFTFAVSCVDADGKSANGNVSFHWTPAPSVSWTGNSGGSADLTSSKVNTTFSISAPAGIKGLILRISTPSSEFADYLAVMGATKSGNFYDLDLFGSAKNESLGLPSVSAIANKGSVSLNLADMIKYLRDTKDRAGSHEFTFMVTDNFDKTSYFLAVYYAK